MSGNNRNRRWVGGVGMAVSAAFAAALIGLANAPVAGAEGSAVDTAVDNFLQGIANLFPPEVEGNFFGDPDTFCGTFYTCLPEPPSEQMIDAFDTTINTAFQPEGPIDNFFDQLFGAASTDPFSWVDQLLGGLSVPAQTSALDMQISIDGTDLFPTAGNTATATSGMGDIAIAIGNGANAGASGSVLASGGDFAFADGANSTAEAGANGNFDSAVVFGANSTAEAGFGDEEPLCFACAPGDFDSAWVFGTNSTAEAGFGVTGPFGAPGLASFDLAAAFGDMLHAVATGGSNIVDIVP